MKPGDTYTYPPDKLPNAQIVVSANMSEKLVSLSAGDATLTMTPDIAIQHARELMHAAYALGYQTPPEKEEKA